MINDRAPAGRWVVDADGSQVNFRARTFFGLLPVNGIFERFAGVLQVADDGSVGGALVVEANSIKTGIDRRDEQLLSARFLDAARHPQIRFTAEQIVPRAVLEMRISEEERMTIGGRLELGETTVQLAFPITVIEHGDHIHIEGRAVLDQDEALPGRRQPGLISRRVRVDVALTLRPAGA